jgi:hypothetical protein
VCFQSEANFQHIEKRQKSSAKTKKSKTRKFRGKIQILGEKMANLELK